MSRKFGASPAEESPEKFFRRNKKSKNLQNKIKPDEQKPLASPGTILISDF